MKHSPQDLEKLRHSTAHLLAHAVSEIFPETLLTIGPPTTEGFFYDFLPVNNFKDENLPILESRMHEISKRALPLTHTQIPKEEARKLFANNPFKLELIDMIPDATVGIARQGDFIDLCRGGHVENTSEIEHFKLLNISGSYWRANRDGQALQRITGTAFFSEQDLKEYEQKIEDALRYDHRRLGKELDLFSFHDEGAGFPFFHPKGKKVLNTLMDFIRKKLDRDGYQEISTPIMLNESLWKRSGHYAHYKDNMYFCHKDEQTYAVKPMNCPGSTLIFSERPRSYRELPMRLADFGTLHRFELSGVLHGLFRVRAFSQDDAHIFCTKDQIEQEVLGAVRMIYEVLKKFDFTRIVVGVSTKPVNALGTDEYWQIATDALKEALTKENIPFEIYEGEGAFYGPKIEFRIEDTMGRMWQCSTVQVDFFMPENFDLSYITSEGTKARPVMIHRAIYGSFERFFGILLEHYKGNLPFWLAPTQVRVLTITDEQKEYARNLAKQLEAHGIRTEIDESSDPISGQIKSAQLQRIPWMLVLGKKEVANNTVTLRYVDGKQEFGLTMEQVLEKAKELS